MLKKYFFQIQIVCIVAICSSLKWKKQLSGVSLHGSFAFVMLPIIYKLNSFVSGFFFLLFSFQWKIILSL